MPPLSARRATTSTFVVITLFALIVGALFPRPVNAQVVPGSTGQTILATPGPTLATPQPFTTPPASGPAPSATPTAPTGRRLAAFHLTAQEVAFYSSKYIVGADGNVDVTLGDGTHVTGNTFAMDLRLNRFVIAGNVTVTAGGTTQHGAAFAEYFDFDRAYFVPITTEPDRWTFVSGDYAHPLLGREMPGDVFFLPDLSGDRMFLKASHATIDPMQSVRFTPAALNFGLGAFVDFPSYFLNFSPNPNFAQNSLPGADVDGPLDLIGGRHGLVTANIRYDSSNKIYPAIELHQVSDRHYVVGSISPLTRPFKQYNLLAFDRISPGLQVQADFQESAFQHSFTQPLAASAYAALQITGSLRQSYLQLATQNYYGSLLGMPQPVSAANNQTLYYYGDPSHNFVPDHPFNSQLNWVGYRQRFTKYFHTQVRSGLSYAHSAQGPLFALNGKNYQSIEGAQAGFDLSAEPVTLLRDAVHRPSLYLTGVFDKQRQYFTTPHHVDTQFENISLTDIVIPRHLSALFSYTNTNTGDFYGGNQSVVYPPSSGLTTFDPNTGQIIPGYAAFRGFATTRSFSEQFVFTPSTEFTLNIALRENRDFPVPVPGTTIVVGPNTSFQNFGSSPYQADLEARFHVTQALVLDVERSYFFGFGGYQRWSPQFYIQILK